MSPKVTKEYREQKKRLILSAAEKVFIRKGFTETTMQDIVSASGLSRGGVYLYFSSTEEIFCILLNEFDQRNFRGLEELYKSVESAWEAVDIFIKMLEKGISQIRESLTPATLEFYISGWQRKSRHVFEVNRYKSVLKGFKKLFQIGVDSGEFKPVIDPETIAHTLITFVDGLSLSVLVIGAGKVQLENQIQSFKAYLKWALQAEC